MSITYKYKKASSDDVASIVRRQTYKIWDYGDTIIYGMPGGKMSVYYFIERNEDSEVLEPAPIGWCPSAAPAYVYEVEAGITKNPDIIVIGEYLRTTEASAPKVIKSISLQHVQQQQRLPKNPKHTSQFKKQPTPSVQQSIPLLVRPVNTKQQDTLVRRKLQPKIPLMTIPLSG
jgi:hypothetical protein